MVGQVVHCTRGSGRETGSPSQGTLGGRHPSVGRGTPSKHTQGCHLPAKSQMLGCCTGPRGALVSSAPHGLVVCRLGPYAVPSLWQGSITEFLPLLTECRGPLQLHTQAHSQGNSNSWSLTALGSGAGGAGAYTCSGPATHTHTHTHDPSVSRGPEPPSPVSHLLPCSTYPCRHWARCTDTEDQPSSASQNSARTHNRACVCGDTEHRTPTWWPRHSTQGHTGSSW